MTKAARPITALLLIVFLIGCQLSPSQRYQLSSDTYTIAVKTVTEASQADLISTEDLQAFSDIKDRASTLLDQWHDAIKSNQEFTREEQLDMLINLMISIAEATQ